MQNLAGLRLERMGLCCAGLAAGLFAGLFAGLAHISRCLIVALNDGVLDRGGAAGFKFEACCITHFEWACGADKAIQRSSGLHWEVRWCR